jgi:acetaldehyde dehydrogenase
MGKVKVAIVGPGNIGIDLMCKLLNRNSNMELVLVVGTRPNSRGAEIAKEKGVPFSPGGLEAVLADDSIKIVFDATTASAHQRHAISLKKSGKIAIDLTPAAVGPYVCPVVNLEAHIDSDNINLITCGGQATIPVIYAISSVVPTSYGEIVATISSKSAGPGTRQSIDEFTITTARGIVEVGGAKKGKAIILLNPAKPPMLMNNTIYATVERGKEEVICKSVENMVKRVQEYVPGYRLKLPPTFDGERVMVMVEVEGSGDYLPTYSGNLDIETCAALAIGDRVAQRILKKSKGDETLVP